MNKQTYLQIALKFLGVYVAVLGAVALTTACVSYFRVYLLRGATL